jgi:uncharacterized cupin superfamily protein
VTEVLNLFSGEWDEDPFGREDGWLANHRLLVPRGNSLGMTLYELQAGQTQAPYHFHHAQDELMLVLRGRPTLRTPDGERELEAGDFAHFPKGPVGAHQVVNRTDEPALYVLGSNRTYPEVCEYPDSEKLLAFSRGESQQGRPLWTVHELRNAVDYFDGEEPRG